MKKLLTLIAITCLSTFPAHSTCHPANNTSKDICLTTAEDDYKKCQARAQQNLENIENGPDGYQIRQSALWLREKGCPSDLKKNLELCKNCSQE